MCACVCGDVVCVCVCGEVMCGFLSKDGHSGLVIGEALTNKLDTDV